MEGVGGGKEGEEGQREGGEGGGWGRGGEESVTGPLEPIRQIYIPQFCVSRKEAIVGGKWIYCLGMAFYLVADQSRL